MLFPNAIYVKDTDTDITWLKLDDLPLKGIKNI